MGRGGSGRRGGRGAAGGGRGACGRTDRAGADCGGSGGGGAGCGRAGRGGAGAGPPDAAARARFLDVLAQTSNVRLAARATQRSTHAFYALRQRDGGFDEAWQQALVQGADLMAGDLISALRGGEGQDAEGDAPPRAIDPKIALEVLKIQARLAERGGMRDRDGAAGTQGRVRHVPLDVVQAELLRRLEAVRRPRRG